MSDPLVSSPDAIPSAKPNEEWKPEPRQWTWKDLFTAPMLAFKPKCMLVAALTLVVLGGWMKLFDEYRLEIYSPGMLVGDIVSWLWTTIALVIFSLGASLVAVFMKADLLDDEFLSFGEAIGQYKTRLLPAVLVPIFLMLLVSGTNALLVWLPILLGGIPYVGPMVYALLYPLGFLASLFVVLLGIAVWLSVFVFPSIIAIRRHGWFDNVVDTIEAVGTKPHLLFGSLLLTLVMMFVAMRIGFAGMDHLTQQLRTQDFRIGDQPWSASLNQTEDRAGEICGLVRKPFDELIVRKFDTLNLRDTVKNLDLFPGRYERINFEREGLNYTVAGSIAGVWQLLIAALIFGYLVNLFVAGGMLTYLVVREDDYWDDEDLEDLDQLAKELEDEAKREQAAETAGDKTAPAGDAKPAG